MAAAATSEKETEAQPIRAEDLRSSRQAAAKATEAGSRLPAGVPKISGFNLQSDLLSRLSNTRKRREGYKISLKVVRLERS